MTDLTAHAASGDQASIALHIKRLLDVTVSLCGLLLAAPIFLVIITANLICGTDPFFVQMRVGQGGRPFACLKFRSMRHGAEAALAACIAADPGAARAWRDHQKLAADPRVTPLGLFMRRWGIDELPQLLNVLRGEMSLVGPRPVVAPGSTDYPGDRAYREGPDFARYIRVRPGITGLWQVSGGPDMPYAARMALDRSYVERWSLWLDIGILLRTPVALLRRRGG